MQTYIFTKDSSILDLLRVSRGGVLPSPTLMWNGKARLPLWLPSGRVSQVMCKNEEMTPQKILSKLSVQSS
eukprot:1055993-Pelagomonas_calceolata.AAC.2